MIIGIIHYSFFFTVCKNGSGAETSIKANESISAKHSVHGMVTTFSLWDEFSNLKSALFSYCGVCRLCKTFFENI